MSVPPPPPWLDGELEWLDLLGRFLDKLDRKPAKDWKQLPSLRLDPNTCPRLFRNDDAAQISWSLFKELDQEGITKIKLDPCRNLYDPEYQQARVQLVLTAEPTLRAWLNRPLTPSYPQAWRQAVDQLGSANDGQVELLRERPLKIEGHSAEDVVQAFLRIADYGQHALTLRQISARCFWGHSKVLDNRVDLVRALYPQIMIQARKLVVNVHLPNELQGILFIENLDSYTSAITKTSVSTRNLAIVYCAGFRGGAQRVRQRTEVSLHYHEVGRSAVQQKLEAWWFDEMKPDYPCAFWGDLDFSGMAILKALRQRFPRIKAWEPGYDQLLACIAGGHTPSAAHKQEQIDPGETGCPYADEVLLPALRKYGLYVDQEMVWDG